MLYVYKMLFWGSFYRELAWSQYATMYCWYDPNSFRILKLVGVFLGRACSTVKFGSVDECWEMFKHCTTTENHGEFRIDLKFTRFVDLISAKKGHVPPVVTSGNSTIFNTSMTIPNDLDYK